MILYQVWVNDHLEETWKATDLDRVKNHCEEIWGKFCREPFPAKTPIFVWQSKPDRDGFFTGHCFWWPHRPFTSAEQRDNWVVEEAAKGHYIRFEILPLDLG